MSSIIKSLFLIILLGGALLSCEKHDNQIEYSVLELKEVSFKVQENSSLLLVNVRCDIIGDTLVECWIPSLLDNKSLIPSIEYDADYCIIDSILYKKGKTVIDFRKPVK